MSSRLFGADGVRGAANIHPMTAEVALALGRAAARRFRREGGSGRVVIGKDTRLSDYMLETNDEWTVARRYMALESLARITDTSNHRLPAVAA